MSLPPTPSSDRSQPAVPRRWPYTLGVNAIIPLFLLALIPIARFVENPDRLDPYYSRIVMLIGINITLAVSLQLINGLSGQFSLGHAGFMAVGAYLAGYPATTYSNDLTSPSAVVVFYLAAGVTVGVLGAIFWAIFALLRFSRRGSANLPLVLLLLLLGWFVWDISAAARAAQTPPYLVWSKLIEAIQAGFSSILQHGAGPAQWLDAHIPRNLSKPLTFLVLLLGGACCAAVAGFIIGLPTLRLRGDYLAIATLGFAEIIRVVITNAEPLGRATGLSVPVYPYLPDPDELAEGVRSFYMFPWIYGSAFVTTLVIWRLQHSAKGKAIAAVREDEIAAAAVGIDTTHHKVLSFVIGAFFAGLAGALFAHYDGYLNPNTFGFIRSIEIVVMVTIGGLTSVWGAMIAAIVLTWLPEFLRDPGSWISNLGNVQLSPGVIDVFKWIGDNRMVVYSLLLIIIMLARSGAFRLPSRTRNSFHAVA